MIDYVYEVRGTDDPIDGDKVRFRSKDEAMAYYEEKKPTYPNAAVYIVEYEFDDFEGADNATSIPEQKTVVQIAGPGVETITTEDGFPNTCDGDNPDCYDENGMFRLPKSDDGLDEDLVEELKDEDIPTDFEDQMDVLAADEDEAIDTYDKVIDKVEDEHVQGELKKIETEEQAHKDYLEKVKEDPTIDYEEPLTDEDEVVEENNIDEAWIDDEHSPRLLDVDSIYSPEEKIAVANKLKAIYNDPNTKQAVIDEIDHFLGDFIDFLKMDGIDDIDNEILAKVYYQVGREGFINGDESEDIESESFAEELFSALSDKRDERAFPDGKLEQEPPHEDVPVVKCKVTPAITHSEDEKPIIEDLVEEDSAGVIDDSNLGVDEVVCEWCGEAKPADTLIYKKNIGLVCPDCADYLAGYKETADIDEVEPDYFNQDFE